MRHPVQAFVVCWNWKAAVLSCILRVPIYLITTFKYGWRAATLAGLVEAFFSTGAAGVYASFTEAVRYAQPQSTVAFLLLVVLPAVMVTLDALTHYVMRTPHLAAGVSASIVVSVLSSGFSWYSMRQGTLLIGSAARPFGSDVSAIPRLIVKFVAEPFVLLWRAAGGLHAVLL
jgi:ascorbate-specific PTS system EIIC-type component UlaA